MIVVAFYCSRWLLEADVIKTGKGCSVDVFNCMIRYKKVFLWQIYYKSLHFWPFEIFYLSLILRLYCGGTLLTSSFFSYLPSHIHIIGSFQCIIIKVVRVEIFCTVVKRCKLALRKKNIIRKILNLKLHNFLRFYVTIKIAVKQKKK